MPQYWSLIATSLGPRARRWNFRTSCGPWAEYSAIPSAGNGPGPYRFCLATSDAASAGEGLRSPAPAPAAASAVVTMNPRRLGSVISADSDSLSFCSFVIAFFIVRLDVGYLPTSAARCAG